MTKPPGGGLSPQKHHDKFKTVMGGVVLSIIGRPPPKFNAYRSAYALVSADEQALCGALFSWICIEWRRPKILVTEVVTGCEITSMVFVVTI